MPGLFCVLCGLTYNFVVERMCFEASKYDRPCTADTRNVVWRRLREPRWPSHAFKEPSSASAVCYIRLCSLPVVLVHVLARSTCARHRHVFFEHARNVAIALAFKDFDVKGVCRRY